MSQTGASYAWRTLKMNDRVFEPVRTLIALFYGELYFSESQIRLEVYIYVSEYIQYLSKTKRTIERELRLCFNVEFSML